MGKQQKLKAQRRAEREQKKKEDAINPPTLGVAVAERVNTADRFGK